MKKWAVLLGLLLLIGSSDAWAVSGRLGEFGVGDSIDVPYYAYNCSGSKRAATSDSVSWWVNKDTLGHYAMPVDSGKVTATTAPSFAVSAGRGFVNYFLRICANAGNHAPGRYTAQIEAWDDTCSQMHIVWWDCYADSTTHEYAKNNRVIAGAVKAKTDSSSFAAAGLIKSSPQTDVTLGGATYGAIATANWAAGTRKLTHFDEDDMTIDLDGTAVGSVTAGVSLNAAEAGSLNTISSNVDAVKAKTDNLPPDPADDSDLDAQFSAVQTDLDNPTQYKATGFATSAQGDSITLAISDDNKANFKADVSAVSTFDPTTDLVTPTDTTESGGIYQANMVEADSDTSAVKNFKRALDGDSTTWAWKFQVRQLQAIADQGNNDAFYLSGFGAGSGLYGTSAGNGYGFHLLGNTNSGLRIGCASGNCDGAYIFGYGDANGLRIESGTSAVTPSAGVYIDGFSDGDGLHIEATKDAVMIKGGQRGVIIDGKPAFVCSSSTDNAIEIYGNQDVVLAGDGTIHGNISLNSAEAGSLNTLMADVDGIKTKTDNLPTDPADDSDIDVQLSAIQTDLDSPNQYKATEFATSAQGDSVTKAIEDDNKVNFKFGMAEGDSVKAHLSTHDSTLLELAAGGASNWTDTQRDSVLYALLDDNKPNFQATGFAVAGDPMTLQSDSLHDLMADVDSLTQAVDDDNKPNFRATGYAVAGDPMTFQSDSLSSLMIKADSATQAFADLNKVNFMATGFATAESVHTAIKDDNKINFKFGGGLDSVRAYLATHDSTLLELASGGSSNWSDAQRDSILIAILDANKVNFKAVGFSAPGDPMTLKGDTLKTLMTNVDGVKAKTDNLPADPADDSDIDSQLSSIQLDLNNPAQYKATGFAVAGDPMTWQGDSAYTLMTDVDAVKAKTDNLPTDPADDSDIDGQLATIQTDLDNPSQYKATGFAVSGDPMTLQSDSLATLMTDIDGIKSKTDNLPTDPADDSDIDAQLNSIATDLNNPDQYKADVWANVDTTDADTSDIGAWLVNNTGGAGGGSDTTSIKAMMQKNWDADTDGELSVETSTGADSSVMKQMMQNNWDTDVDGQLSAEIAGTGSDTLDIIVFDADTTAVEGVDICIYNPTKTAYAIPNVDTDVNGYCQIHLDPASYPVWVERLGIIQAEWDTVTVPSGGGRDTIWVVAQSAGSPPSANVTRLTGYNRDLGYNKHDRLKIVMRPQHGNLLDTCQNVFIITKEMVAYSDTGFFQIDVPPSKCLLSKDGPVDIDSVLYDFLIFYKYNKEFERRGIFVPDSTGNVQVKDLLD